jgi:hypothetical protein
MLITDDKRELLFRIDLSIILNKYNATMIKNDDNSLEVIMHSKHEGNKYFQYCEFKL